MSGLSYSSDFIYFKIIVFSVSEVKQWKTSAQKTFTFIHLFIINFIITICQGCMRFCSDLVSFLFFSLFLFVSVIPSSPRAFRSPAPPWYVNSLAPPQALVSRRFAYTMDFSGLQLHLIPPLLQLLFPSGSTLILSPSGSASVLQPCGSTSASCHHGSTLTSRSFGVA